MIFHLAMVAVLYIAVNYGLLLLHSKALPVGQPYPTGTLIGRISCL